MVNFRKKAPAIGIENSEMIGWKRLYELGWGCGWNRERNQGSRGQKWSLNWRCHGRAKHPGCIFDNSKGHLTTANPNTPHWRGQCT